MVSPVVQRGMDEERPSKKRANDAPPKLDAEDIAKLDAAEYDEPRSEQLRRPVGGAGQMRKLVGSDENNVVADTRGRNWRVDPRRQEAKRGIHAPDDAGE